jgi:hypothetical protein
LKDREIAIKRINTSLEKKIERTNKIFELKGKIKKKIKLTNESKKIKKQRISTFNELNDDG